MKANRNTWLSSPHRVERLTEGRRLQVLHPSFPITQRQLSLHATLPQPGRLLSYPLLPDLACLPTGVPKGQGPVVHFLSLPLSRPQNPCTGRELPTLDGCMEALWLQKVSGHTPQPLRHLWGTRSALRIQR